MLSRTYNDIEELKYNLVSGVGYKVFPNGHLPKGTAIVFLGQSLIHVSEDMVVDVCMLFADKELNPSVYAHLFNTLGLTDDTVRYACEHAKRNVNHFIDKLTEELEIEYRLKADIRNWRLAVTKSEAMFIQTKGSINRDAMSIFDKIGRDIEEKAMNALFGLSDPIPEKTEEEIYLDKLKLAFVNISDEKVMVKCHNETMEAYKLQDDCPSLILPLTKVKYDSFERWCTGFDL